MDAAQEKYLQMTQQPVEKLVCRLTVPSILSMMVSAFYNMADTFFIGKISTQATGAVGVVFSYMALIQAIGFFFGHGSGNYISRALGRRQRDSAAVMAANGFFFCLGCGFVIMAGGFLFMDPMLRALGATETILPEARAYFRWILLASPVMMGTFVLNNQMRLQGNARRGMIGVMSGAVLNILLDPLLIFGFNLGIAGAAIATAFSQLVGFCLLVWLSGRGDGLRPALKDFSPSLRAFEEIAAGGLPSLGRQGLASLATAYLNQAAGVWDQTRRQLSGLEASAAVQLKEWAALVPAWAEEYQIQGELTGSAVQKDGTLTAEVFLQDGAGRIPYTGELAGVTCRVQAQEKDGYLNTYYQIKEPEKKWTNILECHELYCAGHLMEAAVAYFKGNHAGYL